MLPVLLVPRGAVTFSPCTDSSYKGGYGYGYGYILEDSIPPTLTTFELAASLHLFQRAEALASAPLTTCRA